MAARRCVLGRFARGDPAASRSRSRGQPGSRLRLRAICVQAPGDGARRARGAALGLVKAWAPLRHSVFRALWIAQTVSNVGTWMQTVGAQWLILSLGGTALTVSLVQTATTLPTFLIGLPAGALGDILDRRKIMLAAQAFMLVCAAVLGILTVLDEIGIATVLALTFGIGLGSALLRPSWQAVPPELGGKDEIPQAAARNGVSMNMARAVGPAIGGVVVAVTNAGAVFIANAVSFIGVMGVLAWWKRPPQESVLGAEHVTHAIETGVRYVRHSPRLRAVLIRTLRSEEHTSELQSHVNLVCRLLLEKKKTHHTPRSLHTF